MAVNFDDEPRSIAVDTITQHGSFVLCAKSDVDFVVERFGWLGFTFHGISNLPQKQAGYFAQRLATPDRDEHFLCVTPLAGRASLFAGKGQVVLGFTFPLREYQEKRPLFQRYTDLSTAFFTADNQTAHKLVDQMEVLLNQFRQSRK